jgi:predicted site-specific integrase-resolvase
VPDDQVGDSPPLLSTPDAAAAIGVSRGTLYRWWKAGKVEPEWITPGGQAKWDLVKLERQLRKM